MDFIEKFGIDWRIFTAEIVNFLVLLAILSFFFYKKIFAIIEDRQKKIDEGLKKAEDADKILNDANEEKNIIISDARGVANEKINMAVELGQKKKDDIVLKAKSESDKIVSDGKKRGEEEKERIISSSKEDIAKMIILGAEKVLGEK